MTAKHKIRVNSALLIGAAPFALMMGSTPAFAQAPAAAATDDAEIVVTARNRVEKLQDVPLAITSFASKQLEDANVRNLRDIAYLTPGLSITSGGSEFGVNPVIRGQTNLNGGAGDPNVAVFLDGIYISNNTAINIGLIDLSGSKSSKGRSAPSMVATPLPVQSTMCRRSPRSTILMRRSAPLSGMTASTAFRA